ncbi:MAG: tRNA lysidine(34) synthetase [Anaerolineae bacterium]
MGEGAGRQDADRLAFYLLKGVARANRLYRLFAPGERIAVAVSGGKDSAALLELLRRWQGLPRLELAAVHVAAAGVAGCEGGADTAGLEAWFRQLDIPYRIVPMEPPSGKPARVQMSPCFHCAWRRRKALFFAAKELGCRRVALAHHADDAAVTTLLNLVYHGKCETMAPVLEMFGGEIVLIRPLYLLEERDIAAFAQSLALPFRISTCARGQDTRRAHLAGILRQLEALNSRVKRNLLKAAGHALEEVDKPQEAG